MFRFISPFCLKSLRARPRLLTGLFALSGTFAMALCVIAFWGLFAQAPYTHSDHFVERLEALGFKNIRFSEMEDSRLFGVSVRFQDFSAEVDYDLVTYSFNIPSLHISADFFSALNGRSGYHLEARDVFITPHTETQHQNALTHTSQHLLQSVFKDYGWVISMLNAHPVHGMIGNLKDVISADISYIRVDTLSPLALTYRTRSWIPPFTSQARRLEMLSQSEVMGHRHNGRLSLNLKRGTGRFVLTGDIIALNFQGSTRYGRPNEDAAESLNTQPLRFTSSQTSFSGTSFSGTWGLKISGDGDVLFPSPLFGSGQFILDDKELVFAPFSLDFEDYQLRGRLSLTHHSAKTKLDATLALNHLDMLAFAPVLSDLSRHHLVPSDTHFEDNVPHAKPSSLFSLFNGIDIDLRLSLDRFIARHVHSENVALSVIKTGSQFDGRFILHDFFKGDLSLRFSSSSLPLFTTPFDLSVRVQNILVEDAFRELFSIVEFSGKGDFDVNISSHGYDVFDFIQNASGSAQFQVDQGTLYGLDLDKLQHAGRGDLKSALDARGGLTRFDSFEGTFALDDGRADIQSARLYQNKSYQATLTGSLLLVEQIFDISGRVSSLSENVSQQQQRQVPFVIKGAFSKPLIIPSPELLF